MEVDGGAAPVAGLDHQLEITQPLAAQDQLGLAVQAGGQVEVEGALGGQVAGPRPDGVGQVWAAQLLLALDHQSDGHGHGVQLAQDLHGQEEAGQAALLELALPLATTAGPTPGRSRTSAANGGELQSGSWAGWTSYMP